MKKKKVIKATEARNSFQEIIDNVHYIKKAIIISKHNKPWVEITPLKESNKDNKQ